ncbi:LuxR C-terminal-related transcriptional regulator [uncultured Aquimarina sp.]|uniref:LuxR C-terminal-related transcriptional regulator n=1 Tax=uncultured Aquimarina sp. TaxID=575652 RepID=UPI00263A37DE|nr:LuxR C-terminal-related transcriptional regulator [uncultured Aquimarina sp.]
MNFNEQNIIQFKESVARHLDTVSSQSNERTTANDFGSFPLIRGKQCLYIMDWKQSKLTYTRHIEDMLGYTEEEFSMDIALNYFHPDDNDFVKRVVKAIVIYCIDRTNIHDEPYLLLTFRLQRKDGSYIKVLRQSFVLEKDSDGKMISNLSLLTDISFIDDGDRVSWDIYGNNIDQTLFKKQIHEAFDDFFTNREKEIIQLIEAELSNAEIAKKLFISKHTVATHRKNIFKKSQSHNTKQLIQFCKKNGVL